MGREASGTCFWGARTGRVTLHLDAVELIVRGEIRTRIAVRAIGDPRLAGDRLAFEFGGETIAFDVGGAAVAKRWVAALVARPPTLAHKLGIATPTRVFVVGALEPGALDEAIATAGARATSLDDADLAIVRADDADAFDAFVAHVAAHATAPPVWIVYVKGRAAPLGERTVRATMRAAGFADTKVASISERLTALRFTRVIRS